MSMIACDKCGFLIDSDDDPNCFVEDELGDDIVLCERCRDGQPECDVCGERALLTKTIVCGIETWACAKCRGL